MKKKTIKLEFDPDRIHLTRKQIIRIIDAIIKGWQKNGKANFLYIAALNAFKAAVWIMSEDDINEFWHRFTRAFMSINEASQYARLKAEYKKGDKAFALAFEDAIARIESGELWQ